MLIIKSSTKQNSLVLEIVLHFVRLSLQNNFYILGNNDFHIISITYTCINCYNISIKFHNFT